MADHRPALVAILGLVFFSTALLGGCTSSAGEVNERLRISGGGDAGATEAVPVEVVSLEQGEMESVLRFSANLEAESQVQVQARAAGRITKLMVEEGDVVKRGQVILRLEEEEQRIALARVDNDLAQAQRELERQTAMHAKGVTSDQALASAQFETKRLKLMRRDAALALRYATVRAPIAGTVTLRMVKLGQTVSLGQPLIDVTDFDSLVARVFVPEKELPRLKPDLPARVVAQAEQHDGMVDRIAPSVDPQSGTIKVTIAVPRHPRLLPGMFVEVALVMQKRGDAVLLPKRALVYDNEIPYAFKIVDGPRASRVRVEPALENRDYIQPTEGFAPGDQVVIAGQIGLKDNAAVEVSVRGPKAALAPTQADPDAGGSEDESKTDKGSQQ